jgi:hypothetical protein
VSAAALSTTIALEIDPLAEKIEVRCIAKAGSNRLEIEGVTFHDLSDSQYQQIVDAIETYLLRKQLRDRERAKSGATTPAPGEPS